LNKYISILSKHANRFNAGLLNFVIDISFPFAELVVLGLELTTLILYFVPDDAVSGMVASIVPEDVPDKVPILTGLLKLRVEFES